MQGEPGEQGGFRLLGSEALGISRSHRYGTYEYKSTNQQSLAFFFCFIALFFFPKNNFESFLLWQFKNTRSIYNREKYDELGHTLRLARHISYVSNLVSAHAILCLHQII